MSLLARSEVGGIFAFPRFLSQSPEAASFQSKEWDPSLPTPGLAAFPVPSRDRSELARMCESEVFGGPLAPETPSEIFGAGVCVCARACRPPLN